MFLQTTQLTRINQKIAMKATIGCKEKKKKKMRKKILVSSK